MDQSLSKFEQVVQLCYAMIERRFWIGQSDEFKELAIVGIAQQAGRCWHHSIIGTLYEEHYTYEERVNIVRLLYPTG